MKKINLGYILVSVLLYISILYTKIFNFNEVSKIIIPLFVLMVLGYVFKANSFNIKNSRWLYFAFFFALTGDVLINLTPYNQYSVISFIFTHICLSIYYIINNSFKKRDFNLLIPVLLVSLLIGTFIFKIVFTAELKIVFVVYLMVLSFMVWRAICFINSTFSAFKKTCIIVGSIMFYFTDISVILSVLNGEKMYVIITWALYPPALVLLSIMNSEKLKS